MRHHDWLEEALATDTEAGDISILLGLRAAVMTCDGVRIAAPAPLAAQRCCAACGQAPYSND